MYKILVLEDDVMIYRDKKDERTKLDRDYKNGFYQIKKVSFIINGRCKRHHKAYICRFCKDPK